MEQDTSQDERRSTFRFRAGALDVEASGPESFTTKVFEEFKSVLVERIESLPAEAMTGPQEEPGGAPAGAGAKPSLRDFYTACGLSAEHARVTAFAYYRKHHEGVDSINQSDAERMYNEVDATLPNVGAALSNAARKDRGWLKRIGKGTYQIIGAGESMMRRECSAALR